MSTPKTLKAHVFICTNLRQNGESCGAKNSQFLRDQLKKTCKAKGGQFNDARINASGCLDRCENGIASVIYPQAIWKCNLTDKDEQVLLDELSKILR